MAGIGRYLAVLAMAPIGLAALASGTGQNDPAARARVTVAKAEIAVEAARREHALWTTADEALRAARHALEQGDSAAAIEQARVAMEHARLGIEQSRLPLVR